MYVEHGVQEAATESAGSRGWRALTSRVADASLAVCPSLCPRPSASLCLCARWPRSLRSSTACLYCFGPRRSRVLSSRAQSPALASALIRLDTLRRPGPIRTAWRALTDARGINRMLCSKILGTDERHARLQPNPSCTYLCTSMNASWSMRPRPRRAAQPQETSATWTPVSNVPHRTSAT
ncbi:hypothetical protein K466DRAFT_592290 [Polyporus arcularius HHB13444]|uniref:Uncharacterized protein n=1 Tax=Polyporus arcularius HHB13444 TaxID=1314778 RepID=A0A5C3P1P3_9APHY|nr:hypothetical protein K466DRAFT_592290 [Polyporus arcularius HHB13444]